VSDLTRLSAQNAQNQPLAAQLSQTETAAVGFLQKDVLICWLGNQLLQERGPIV